MRVLSLFCGCGGLDKGFDETGYNIVWANDFDKYAVETYKAMNMLYDDVPDTLSQLIRTAFVPRKGMEFIVSDFSAIEARVLSHLAGEKWRTDVFASGGDIYCALYAI